MGAWLPKSDGQGRSMAYAIPDAQRQKLGKKSEKLCFVGYSI